MKYQTDENSVTMCEVTLYFSHLKKLQWSRNEFLQSEIKNKNPNLRYLSIHWYCQLIRVCRWGLLHLDSQVCTWGRLRIIWLCRWCWRVYVGALKLVLGLYMIGGIRGDRSAWSYLVYFCRTLSSTLYGTYPGVSWSRPLLAVYQW